MTSMRSLSWRPRGGCKQHAEALLTAAVLAVLAACGGGDGTTAAGPAPSLPTVCSPVRSPEKLPGTHIADGKTATYNSTPPSSGEHYARWVTVGVYAAPIPNERQVHNLEHGHVMIQYRDLSADQVAELEAIVKADPKMVLLAPYPSMDPRLALTSWGKIQTCDGWEAGVTQVVRYFIRTNRDNAPESIP
jgi:hypothetical protein